MGEGGGGTSHTHTTTQRLKMFPMARRRREGGCKNCRDTAQRLIILFQYSIRTRQRSFVQKSQFAGAASLKENKKEKSLCTGGLAVSSSLLNIAGVPLRHSIVRCDWCPFPRWMSEEEEEGQRHIDRD